MLELIKLNDDNCKFQDEEILICVQADNLKHY